LRGIGPPDRMLAAPWRRLFLAAFWAIPGTWLLLSCVTARCGRVLCMVCVCQTLIKNYFTLLF